MASDLRSRLLRPAWPWALAVAVAVLVIVLGLLWHDTVDFRTSNRDTWSARLIILTGLGVLVVEALRRVRLWLGIAGLVGLIVVAVAAQVVIVEEKSIESFSESDRRPTASADQLPEPGAPGTAEPSPLLDDPSGLEDLRLELEPFATDLSQPIAIEPVPGTDVYYVLERTGAVRVVDADGSVGEPVVDLADETSVSYELGVLDLALDTANERLYVSFTDSDNDSRVVSYAIGDDQSLTDRRDVIVVDQPFETHNGGGIEFDLDGYLLFGLGDGGRLRDALGTGQDRTNRLSTMLRVVPAEDGGYLIPPDNPYIDVADVWPEIWAYGLRNPWRFSVDSITGELWIGDVGQDAKEEVDHVAYGDHGGANFGWGILEGDEIRAGQPDDPTGYTEADVPDDYVGPVFTYEHDPTGVEGARNSVTGGYVYRGRAIPELWGAYVYADFSASVVGGVVFDEAQVPVASADLISDVAAPVAFGLDRDGEIFVVSLGGTISRLVEA